jgi:replicative DNA helicase
MDENLKIIVEQYPEVFEGQVMINLLRNQEFFDRVAASINSETSGCKDFSNGADNVIFSSIKLCRATLAHATGSQVLARQDVMAMMSVLHSRGAISETEFQIAGTRLIELSDAEAMSPDMIFPAVAHWLKKKRGEKFIALAAAGSIGLEELQKKIELEVDSIAGDLDETTSFSFNSALEESQKGDVKRYKIGLSGVDKAMGGGVAKKEFSLFAIPSGGGKTVLACQFAQCLCGQDLRGLLITTEQSPKELIPRMVSAQCHVPFEIIKDGVKENRLNPEQLARLESQRKRLETSLIIEDWGKSDHDVAMELPALIRKARQKLGSVDFVILDWIGGSLGAGLRDNLSQYRLILKLAADSLAHHANKLDLITIGFAQTNPTLSKNKKKVDRTMLGESKTMGDKATNIVGVSALQALDEEEGSGKSSYFEKQFAFLDKARKGTGGLVPIHRDFAFQRFLDWGK